MCGDAVPSASPPPLTPPHKGEGNRPGVAAPAWLNVGILNRNKRAGERGFGFGVGLASAYARALAMITAASLSSVTTSSRVSVPRAMNVRAVRRIGSVRCHSACSLHAFASSQAAMTSVTPVVSKPSRR